MPESRFTAACVQMRSGRDPVANRDAAVAGVREAAARGAAYVQTPEMTSLVERSRERLFAHVTTEEEDQTLAALREAARQTGKYAIGVDADQYSEAPGRVLTSMVKGIDVAVIDAIRKVKDHTFKGGVFTYGLAENGVGYVYDENNKGMIPDSVRSRLEQIKADIVAGKIKVPSTR